MGQAVYQRRCRKRTVNGYATVSGVSEIRGEKTITTAEAGVVLDHLLDGTLSGVQYAWSMSDILRRIGHSRQSLGWNAPPYSPLHRHRTQNTRSTAERRAKCFTAH